MTVSPFQIVSWIDWRLKERQLTVPLRGRGFLKLILRLGKGYNPNWLRAIRLIFTVGNYEREPPCFGAKEMQALLLESTTNLVPASDLTLNLKPVSSLNKKKALLDGYCEAKAKQQRTGKWMVGTELYTISTSSVSGRQNGLQFTCC